MVYPSRFEFAIAIYKNKQKIIKNYLKIKLG
jgi:hypothetical protein